MNRRVLLSCCQLAALLLMLSAVEMPTLTTRPVRLLGPAPAAAWGAEAPATLTWDAVARQALREAPELKAAELTVAIEGTRITEARSEYFPQVQLQATTEYLRDLSDNRTPGVNVVGDSIIVTNTQFQNSAGVNARMVLWDFGQRRLRVDMARSGQNREQAQTVVERRELLLSLAETYNALWTALERRRIRQALVGVTQDLYNGRRRLFEAGELGKPQLAEGSLLLVEAQQALERVEEEARRSLVKLNRLAHTTYALDDLAGVQPLMAQVTTTAVVELNLDEAPELKRLDAEMASKELEQRLLLRQRWAPTVVGQVGYFLFGADRSNWPEGINNTDPASARISLSVQMPVFDGFRNAAQRQRVQFELQRLALQKTIAQQELTEQWQQAEHLRQAAHQQAATGEAAEATAADWVGMAERLTAQQWVDREALLRTRQRQLEQALNRVEWQAKEQLASKRLVLLADPGASGS